MDDLGKFREFGLLRDSVRRTLQKAERFLRSRASEYPPPTLKERIAEICMTVEDMLDELKRRDDAELVPGGFELEQLRTRLREWVAADDRPIGESLEREFWSLVSCKNRTLYKLRDKVSSSRGIQRISEKLDFLEILSKERTLSPDELRAVKNLKWLLAYEKELFRRSQVD